MPHEVLTFSITDPRHFDGDPFEVAERACRQAEAVARVLATATQTATIMARNAELERNLMTTPEDARAEEWEDSLQARRLAQVHKASKQVERALGVLGKAAGYNPKRPAKA
jgi:hypothetical protein